MLYFSLILILHNIFNMPIRKTTHINVHNLYTHILKHIVLLTQTKTHI